MKMKLELKGLVADRRNERGAALISVLLLSMLLLIAGGALVLTTSMSATNAIDSTAEMQAYYGAEAGLQTTINVMRGNVWNDDDTPDISFRQAVEPDTSNVDDDPATDEEVARLSNWLSYEDTESYPSRVIANGQEGVHAIAYDVTARDVDDSKTVQYATTATFDAGESDCTVSGGGLTVTCGAGANTFTLTYTPQASTTLMAYPAVAAGLGSFQLTRATNGANEIEEDKPVILRLRINQNLPWAAYDTITATVSGEVKNTGTTLNISFAGASAIVEGTDFALCAACKPLTLTHPPAVGTASTTSLTSTLTAPQPRRILIRSTGYGPKGAIKRLEMLLNQSVFEFEAPAVLTFRGADDGTAITFESGSSGAKTYSGIDHAELEIQLPTFAVSGGDVDAANGGISKHGTIDDPELAYLDHTALPADTEAAAIQVSTPEFLRTADDARAALVALRSTAEGVNRYFTPEDEDGSYTVSAANTTATGITFVDGDCNLEGGSGLVVVTGELKMHGNPSFSGVILVLGEGKVTRKGGGNGDIYGAIVVASFDRAGTGGFLAPEYTTSGGGNSTLQYDSLAVSRATGALGAVSGGMREF